MKTQRKKIRAGFFICLCALFLISCGSGKGSAENKKGLSYYEDGNYEKAVSAFDEAIKKDENCAEYYVNKGMAQLGLSDYESAKKTLTEGMRIAPEDAGIFRAAGIVCSEEGKFEEACDYFSSALNCLGTNKGQEELKTDIYLYKADAESKRGNYQEAAEDYSSLISMDRKQADYYLLRGKAYASAGSLEDAMEDFEEVKALSPKKMDYYVEMYLILEENGFPEEGKTYLEAALSQKATTSEDKKNRGAIQYLLGNYEEAKSELLDVKEKERDANTWIYLGLTLEALGENETAGQAYEKALAVTENKASVYYQMALCQIRTGDYSRALENSQAGIRENDAAVGDKLAYIEAVCYEYLRDFQTALQKFTAYRDTYGSNEKIDHEIAFLETRVQ